MGHRSSVAHGCLVRSCHRLLKLTFLTSVNIIPINLSDVKVTGISPDGSDLISLCHITYRESIFLWIPVLRQQMLFPFSTMALLLEEVTQLLILSSSTKNVTGLTFLRLYHKN